jgi:PilZ domain
LSHREELPEDKNTTLVPGTDTVPNLSKPTSLAGDKVQFADTRRHPRVQCFLAVELRPEGEGTLVLGSVSDVSLGGCCVETPSLLRTSTAVAIRPLEANSLLWVKGIVLNTRMAEGTGNFKIGIKFLEADPVPPHSLQEFLRFVEENGTKQAPNDSSYLRGLAGN